jgi:hypothetical protein
MKPLQTGISRDRPRGDLRSPRRYSRLRESAATAGFARGGLPAAVVLPPLVGLAGLVLILAALIVVETTRYARIRRNLRGAESPASS